MYPVIAMQSKSSPSTGYMAPGLEQPATEASASLCSFYDRDAPIYTMSRFLPPSKVQGSEVNNSILGDGCVVRCTPCIQSAWMPP